MLLSLFVLIGVYALTTMVVYRLQDRFVYVPDAERIDPLVVGFDAAEIELRTGDGHALIAWWRAPVGDQPVILYFHGNAGGLGHRAQRFGALTATGNGLFAMSYRGYSGSQGRPSQVHNFSDAERAYDWLLARGVKPRQIVLYGESLGTGIAIKIAADHAVGALILEAPYTSLRAVASSRFPFSLLPVKYLMRDQYRSDEIIDAVTVPVLVMHGIKDRVIPYRLGQAIFAKIIAEQKFLRPFAEGDHNNLYPLGAGDVARAFIANVNDARVRPKVQ